MFPASLAAFFYLKCHKTSTNYPSTHIELLGWVRKLCYDTATSMQRTSCETD